MKIFLSLIPSVYIVLDTIWNLGAKRPEYVIDGQLIVTAILLCLVLWLSGYIAGRD